MINKIGFALIAGLAGAATTGQAALAGDAEAGAKTFRRCAACHSVEEGKRKVGPSLYGVYGRAAGSLDGFRYSPAMTAYGATGVVWNDETLDAFLANPKGVVPKTRMTAPPLRSADDRANVITYLQTVSGD